jgi:hypothetical protein
MTVQRKAALVCGKQGPWVATRNMTNPHVRITGLKSGTVTVHTHGSKAEFQAAGEHPVPSAEWMRVCYEGPDRVVCAIITRRVA